MTRTRNCSNNQWVYCIGDSFENKSLCKDYIYIKNEFILKKSTMLGILNVLRKEYIVSFNVMPIDYTPGFKNVLHLTLGNDMKVYGDRNPGVWFHHSGTGKLRIHTALNRNYSYFFDTSLQLIRNRWTNIKIYQKMHNGFYWFFVDLNGNNIHAIQNLNATDFVNIKVYVSDPWYDAQNCFMSDLLIINTDAVWVQWSTWSSCNHFNGYGSMNRTRECRLIDAPDLCFGNSTDIKECYEEKSYEVVWSQWIEWSQCNASCIITRTRNCSNCQLFNSSNRNFTEVKSCELYQASWAHWSIWVSCNDSFKFIMKKRECNNVTTCDLCYGVSSEVIESSAKWSQWSDWSRYNDSYGFMNRTRECYILEYHYVHSSFWSSFIAFYGIMNKSAECMKMCSGYNLEFAFWTSWSNWSICNDTYGFANRSRTCNVSNSMNQCDGNNFEIMECYAIWSQWSIWSSCNGTYGFKNRTRLCNISRSVDQCYGRNIEVVQCIEKWAAWSECSTTCGISNKSRISLQSTYSDVMVESCTLINCPEDGMWGKWDKPKCSKTCGSGIIVFNRSCNNPRPSFNGHNCMGVSSYTEDCNQDTICPLNGNWSMWSSWSLCSQPCGGGVKARFRSCSNPMPHFGGWDCVGSVKDLENCAWQNCKSVNLNMAVIFIDEMYTNWDFQLTKFNLKIHNAIAKLYRSQSVNKTFNVVIHSIENRP